jgi:hypothetical protein
MIERSNCLLSCGALTLLAALTAFAVRAEPAACNSIPGADQLLLRAGKVILVGEQHGTAESPAFVLDLACQAVKSDVPIQVGVELPESERERVQAFLASNGDIDARRALTSGGRWQADYQYGLTSEAMLGLFEGLRALARQGHDLRIVLFDQPGGGGSEARDRRMAEYLAGVVSESTDALFVVLTGNIHSRVSPGTRWNPEYETMGYLLSKSIPSDRIVALDVAHSGGTAWVCLGSDVADCGERTLGGRGPEGDGITLDGTPEETGHHGWYHVGTINASPPARDALGNDEENAAIAEPAALPDAEVLWQLETGG